MLLGYHNNPLRQLAALKRVHVNLGVRHFTSRTKKNLNKQFAPFDCGVLKVEAAGARRHPGLRPLHKTS